MKKNILLLSLPFIAVSLLGCNQEGNKSSTNTGEEASSSSSESEHSIDFSKTLSALQSGYELEVVSTIKYVVTGGSGSETTYKTIENISSSNGRYRHIGYSSITNGEPNKDIISFDEYYTNENEKLVKNTLSLENKIESEKITNNNKEVSWNSSNLNNFFTLLNEDDFVENEGVYSLTGKLNALKRMHLVTQLRGYPYTAGLVLSTFSLSPKKDGTIDFAASFEPYKINYLTEIDVTESFEGKFISAGKEATPISPIEKEEDPLFKNGIEKLSSLNFKTSVKNSEILHKDGRYETVATAEGKVASNGFNYTFYDKNNKISEDTIYYVKDNGMQRVAKYGNKLFASGKKIDSTISSYWPSFKISNAFFEKENNVYTLSKKYLGYFASTNLFTPFVKDKINDLTITIDTTKITIVNENEGNGKTIFKAKEEIVYEGFLAQEDIDISAVSFDSSTLTWAEAIRDSTKYRELATAMGGVNYLNLIPFFGGPFREARVELGSEFEYIYTAIDSLEEGNSLKERYATELPKKGFVADTDENGETSYILTIDETKKLEIYPVAFEEQNILTGEYTGTYYFAISFLLSETK